MDQHAEQAAEDGGDYGYEEMGYQAADGAAWDAGQGAAADQQAYGAYNAVYGGYAGDQVVAASGQGGYDAAVSDASSEAERRRLEAQDRPIEHDSTGQTVAAAAVGVGIALAMGEAAVGALAVEAGAVVVERAAEGVGEAVKALGEVGGSDAGAWANDDHENTAEKGALEIEARVDAPITGGGDIRITGANWRGQSHEKERGLKESGGTIQDLHLNLRITVETPVGETRCEITHAQMNSPIVPEKSTLQGVMAWLFTGKVDPNVDGAAVISYAAALGTYIMQKPASELAFG